MNTQNTLAIAVAVFLQATILDLRAQTQNATPFAGGLPAVSAESGPRQDKALRLPGLGAGRRASAASPVTHNPKLITINIPGSIETYAQGVNNQQEVVGSWNDSQLITRGFLYSHGSLINVDYPGAAATVLTGINDNGDIAGAFEDQFGIVHGFVLSASHYTVIDYPGAVLTQPNAINAAGDVVGFYQVGGVPSIGFLWQKGTFTTLPFPSGATDFPPGNQ